MTVANNMNVGSTMLTHSFDGVHHWYGTAREAVIIQSQAGVVERLRNAYFHNHPDHNRYYLLDNTKPAMMERILLNGNIEIYFAEATNDEAVAPTWKLTALFDPLMFKVYEDIITTKQLKSEIAPGTPPLEVASDTFVDNLNVQYVNSIEAATTPQANKLLALESNAKFNNNALNMGHENGIDVDTVDGMHASEFVPKQGVEAHRFDYESDWFTVTANTDYPITHNLNVAPRLVVVHFRVNSSSNVTGSYPLGTRANINGDSFIRMLITNLNTVTIRPNSPFSGVDGVVGVNASGGIQSAGEYKVYVAK